MLRLQVHPKKAIVVRREKTTVAAVWFGAGVLRPHVYPFLGPGNLEVTRLGHPGDPVGHSHHRSIWMGHRDVDGIDFWGESPRSGTIQATDVATPSPEGDEVICELECQWLDLAGKPLLGETRRLRFIDLGRGELALEIDSTLRSTGSDRSVTLGDTPFGLLGIRVARTVRVAERLGGLILNSAEAENEMGCFWQHAEWCDYSGPVPVAGKEGEQVRDGSLPAATIGIACFDHPRNSPSDTIWHVRDDGWMGPCISKGAPRAVTTTKPLRARFRIEAHGGRAWHARIPDRYRAWRRQAIEED